MKAGKLTRAFIGAVSVMSLVAVCAGVAAAEPLASEGEPEPINADASSLSQVADPSTVNDWKALFTNAAGSTENAGRVWADKSVFADDGATVLTSQLGSELQSESTLSPVEVADNAFLVTLSTIASTKAVTEQANIPTDTIIVLDLSSSMYIRNGDEWHSETVKPMIDATNETITNLQKLNEHNRVGVVIYFGKEDLLPSDETHGMVMLPLDRYTLSSGSTYIEMTKKSNQFSGLKVSSGVTSATGKTVDKKTHTATSVAGTYTQLGIQLAREEFLNADPIVASTRQTRLPVMVLMSDGVPTAASAAYASVETAHMGNNYTANRNPAETDFVTQLTAAYSKELIDAHYVATKPLFYTLSLGDDISMDVMDPATASTSFTSKIETYWNELIADQSVQFNVTVYKDRWGDTGTKKVSRTVTTTTTAGKTFPTSIEQQNYVDRSYSAQTADDLAEAFAGIVSDIQLQSAYAPTFIDASVGDELSGYVEFYDLISEYMEVRDVEGIVSDGALYTGESFSERLKSALGTTTNPTDLGNEFIWSIQARLGVSVQDARDLVGKAFNAGQLSYNGAGQYSNYFGWWATEDKEYIGFWNGADTKAPANAHYAIKSYSVLGDTSGEAEAGSSAGTEMLYSYVDVCQVVTDGTVGQGETRVIWGVPASLLPIVVFSVDVEGELADGTEAKVSLGGADSPIRLLFEVGLRSEYSDATTIAAEMMNAGSGDNSTFKYDHATGTYTFYTNEWLTKQGGQLPQPSDHPLTHTNTTAYFEPSRENERYYHVQDDPIYVSDENGGYELYAGAKPTPNDGKSYYFAHYVYEWTGNNPANATAVTHYDKIDADALSHAASNDNGEWIIPAGTYLYHTESQSITKTENKTETLSYVRYPVMNETGSSASDDPKRMYAVAALGNNGTVSLTAATGFVLTKEVEGPVASEAVFGFTVTALDANGATNTAVNGEYGDVTFADGIAEVELNAGFSLSFTGIPAGKYQIEETEGIGDNEHYEFVRTEVSGADASSVTQEGTKTLVTVNDKSHFYVTYVNKLHTKENLILSKKVVDAQGVEIEAQRWTDLGKERPSFTFDVTLDYTGAIMTTDEGGQSAIPSSYTTSRTVNGQPEVIAPNAVEGAERLVAFSVDVRADETLIIYGLPTGTKVTVSERTPANSAFTLYYALEAAPYYESEAYSDELNDETTSTPAEQSLVSQSFKEADGPSQTPAGLEGTIPTDGNLAFGIVNQYVPAKVTADVSLATSKTLLGRNSENGWIEGDAFTFNLQRLESLNQDGTGNWVTVDSVTLNANARTGSFDETAVASLLTFDKAGSYWFRIIEVLPTGDGVQKPEGKTNEAVYQGITYNSDDHKFVVTVTDDLLGNLTVSEISTQAGAGNVSTDSFTITGNSTEDQQNHDYSVEAKFTNAYRATGTATVEVTLHKTVLDNTAESGAQGGAADDATGDEGGDEGASGDEGDSGNDGDDQNGTGEGGADEEKPAEKNLSPAGYRFGLYQVGADGEPDKLISTATLTEEDITGEEGNEASALRSHTFTFSKDLVAGIDETGTHSYYVQEIIPAEADPLLTYDTAKHGFTLTVTDNGDGTLAISDPIWALAEHDHTGADGLPVLEFVNSYEPEEPNDPEVPENPDDPKDPDPDDPIIPGQNTDGPLGATGDGLAMLALSIAGIALVACAIALMARRKSLR